MWDKATGKADGMGFTVPGSQEGWGNEEYLCVIQENLATCCLETRTETLHGAQAAFSPWLPIFTQLSSSFRGFAGTHTQKKRLKQLQNSQTNKCSDARHNHYSADCHKIVLGPETQEPKGCYCKSYVRAKVPLAQGDFNCSKAELENMNPLVLREKQVSKNTPKRSTNHLTLCIFSIFIHAIKILSCLTAHE